eukprot:TRINITY_DN68560_c0_g1_i1.p1 TRINITY_DN68560_c0_g1~~TRINITY_DN68560_c0_g1_i1.p1  ORF type:complete len:279 (-),score=54.64 TRINITY_DN68560_c0_g1_i1:225-1061(-)
MPFCQPLMESNDKAAALTADCDELPLQHTQSFIDETSLSQDSSRSLRLDFLSGRQRSLLGLSAMLGSSFLFSLMALLVKCLPQFGTFELVFWRSVFMLLGTMLILAARRTNPLGPSGSRVILTARAVAGFGFMSTYYYAIHILPLSDAVVITYTSPVITGLAAAVLLGEAWGLLDAIGSGLCLVGVVLISKPSFIMRMLGVKMASPPVLGTFGALAAAFLSSCVYLLLRKGKDLDAIVSVNYFAFAGIVLSPICSYAQEEPFIWPDGGAWLQLGKQRP